MPTDDWKSVFTLAVSVWGGFVFLRLVCIARAALVMHAESEIEERHRDESARKDLNGKAVELDSNPALN